MIQSATSSNPLYAHGTPPRFEEVTPEHASEAVPVLLEQAAADFSAFEESVESTWEGIFERLRVLTEPLGYAWHITGHLMGVRNSDELRAVHEELQPKVIEFFTSMGQSTATYAALEELMKGESWTALDSTRQRLVEKELLGMKLSGISLKGAEKERFNEIQKELAELSTGFSNAVLDSRKSYEMILTDLADVEGFPETLRQTAAAAAKENGHDDATPEAGPWRISLDGPVAGPFLMHCKSSALREEVYRALVTVASTGEHDNKPRIDRILTLRREKAQLLGYSSHAEISLATKMAEDVDSVDALTEELRAAAMPKAKEDHAELVKFAREQTGDADLELANWDAGFWAERMREKQYDISDEELRPYFPFPKVLEGLFSITKRLFDVDVVAADGEVQVWHPDVRYFRIKDAKGEDIASFYLDPFSRPADKRGGAWMDNLIGRAPLSDDSLRLPTAVLVCNQTPPAGERPSLMTHREVETLFHEFGHGLQHMLTTVDVPQAAGIESVEWDAVELPSQFMENWTYHEETVMGFAGHFETGESLPKDLFDRLVAAKNYRSGSGVLRQLYFGHLDMELHHRYDPSSDETVAEVKERVVSFSTVVPPLAEDHFECSFSHIFAGGYSAGYYSYKWAEVLSADAFSAFEEAGLDDEAAIEEMGRKFRDTVLAQGGSRHPMEIFQDFRGRGPSTDALKRHTGLI
jgi:oligopeptidase A